jgi:predicted GTPase
MQLTLSSLHNPQVTVQQEAVKKDEKTQNVLIVGRVRSGKTTLCKLLHDLFQVVKFTGLFRDGTREPALHESDLSGYQLRVLDTPGLCEHAPKGKAARTNSEIIELIKGKVKELFGGQDFENVDTVLMTFTVDAGINSEDMLALETFLPLLPEKTKKILVISHAEGLDDNACDRIRSQIHQYSPLAKLVHSYFRGNILFSGAVEQFYLDHRAENSTTSYLSTMHKDRERLIAALLPVPESQDLKNERLEKTAEKAKAFLDQHFPENKDTESN